MFGLTWYFCRSKNRWWLTNLFRWGTEDWSGGRSANLSIFCLPFQLVRLVALSSFPSSRWFSTHLDRYGCLSIWLSMLWVSAFVSYPSPSEPWSLTLLSFLNHYARFLRFKWMKQAFKPTNTCRGGDDRDQELGCSQARSMNLHVT